MKKPTRDVLIAGVALFAMFFGAGNLIFPPYMGLLAGDKWGWALAGFLVTGIGMPLLGIMAAAKAGGTIDKLGSRVSLWFGVVLSVVIILSIGPLLAIPRTGATAFELGIRPNLPGFSPTLFSIVFFGLTFWFSLNRSTVVDKIGKFLTPFLLLTLGWIIIKGIVNPMGQPASPQLAIPAASGFREGYQTMDALASLVFAQIIIGALIFKGYKKTEDQIRMTFKAGGIAALGLGLVYGGLMYLGASAGSVHETPVERTDLLISISSMLMGNAGTISLGIAVSLACLTTAIGLTATVSEFFYRLTNGWIAYRAGALITVVFSGIFATVGVTTIVNIAYPLLILVYPVAIVLIVLTLVGVPAIHRPVYGFSVAGALLTSIPESLATAGFAAGTVSQISGMLPFSSTGFGWIVPSVTGGLIGLAFIRYRKNVNKTRPVG